MQRVLAVGVVALVVYQAGLGAVPATPQNLRVLVAGSTITLSWDQAPGATGYLLEAGTVSSTGNLARVDLGATTTFVASVPSAGRYYFRVQARDRSGLSLFSNEVVAEVGTRGCAAPPLAPLGLSALATADGSVNLSWNSSGGCPQTSYTVLVGSAPGGSDLAQVTLTNDYLFAAAPFGSYYVRVVASNGAGTSPPSREVVVPVVGEDLLEGWLESNRYFQTPVAVTARTRITATLAWNTSAVDPVLYATTATCPPPANCPRVATSRRVAPTTREISWEAAPGAYTLWVGNPQPSAGPVYIDMRFR